MFKVKLSNSLFKNISRKIFQQIQNPNAGRGAYVVLPENAKVRSNLTLENLESYTFYYNFMELSRDSQNMELNITKGFDESANDYITQFTNIENSISDLDAKYKLVDLSRQLTEKPFESQFYESLYIKTFKASFQNLLTDDYNKLLEKILSSKKYAPLTESFVNQVRQNILMYGSELDQSKCEEFNLNFSSLMSSRYEFKAVLEKSKPKMTLFMRRAEFSDDVPEALLNYLQKSEKLYELPLEDTYCVNETLKYCVKASIRNQIWHRSKQMGGRKLFSSGDSNYKQITDIRKYLANISRIFKKKNFVQYLLSHNQRMAKNLNEIVDVLEYYKSQIVPEIEREYIEFNQFAAKNKGLIGGLREWDFRFIERCYQQEVLNLPENRISLSGNLKFEPIEMFRRMMDIVGNLFELRFTHVSDNSLFSEYQIYDYHGQTIAKLLLTNTDRLEYPYINSFVTGTDDEKLKHVIVNCKIDDSEIHVRHLPKFIELIHEVLCSIYNKHNYSIVDLFETTVPEWHQMTYDIVFHCFTGSLHVLQALFPDEDENSIKDIQLHLMKEVNGDNLELSNRLWHSYFDLEIWLSEKSYPDIMTNLWHKLFPGSTQGKYFPLNVNNEWPCSATKLFSDNYWSGVCLYSQFWSKYYTKEIISQLNKNGIETWNPYEKPNVDLRFQLSKFRNVFFDGLHLYSPSEMTSRFSK